MNSTISKSVRLVDGDLSHRVSDRSPPILDVRVERKVPLIGYALVAIAAVSNATSLLVPTALAEEGEKPPTEQIQILWLGLLSLAISIPLALGRWHRDQTLGRGLTTGRQLHDSQTTLGVALIAAMALFFFRETGFVATAWFTILATDISCPEMKTFVQLTPVAIYVARMLGFPGLSPVASVHGFLGLFCGVMGTLLCVYAMVHTEAAAYAVTMGIASSLFSALNIILTLEVRKTVPASFLHVFYQVVICTCSVLLMAANSENMQLLFADPFNHELGILGFSLLTMDRLPPFSFIAIMSFTIATLGYSISLQYVSPLVVAVAQALQPSIAALGQAVFMTAPPIPSGWFIIGSVLLFLAALFIASESLVTVTLISADTVVGGSHVLVDLERQDTSSSLLGGTFTRSVDAPKHEETMVMDVRKASARLLFGQGGAADSEMTALIGRVS